MNCYNAIKTLCVRKWVLLCWVILDIGSSTETRGQMCEQTEVQFIQFRSTDNRTHAALYPVS